MRQLAERELSTYTYLGLLTVTRWRDLADRLEAKAVCASAVDALEN
jgi:hypothetical protein